MNNIFKSLYWVGPRLSDLIGIEYLFKGAVVLCGKNSLKAMQVYSLEQETRRRININDPKHDEEIFQFYCNSANKIMKSDPNARFIWYTSLPENISKEIAEKSPYTNDYEISNLLSNKFNMRSLLADKINVIPCKLCLGFEVNNKYFQEIFPGYDKFVLQRQFGSGGYQTYIVNADDTSIHLNRTTYLISPYQKNALPINQHLIVGANKLQVLHPSIQLIKEIDNRLMYVGCDYSLPKQLDKEIINSLNSSSHLIGMYCQNLGYRGLLGIDYLLTQSGEIAFLEINPRFQGSTSILNLAYKNENHLSVHELHILSFLGKTGGIPENIKSFSSFNHIVSSPSYQSTIKDIDKIITTPDSRNSEFNVDKLRLLITTDNAQEVESFELASCSHRYILDRPIAALGLNNEVNILPALLEHAERTKFYDKSINRNEVNRLARFKFDLFAFGIKIGRSALGEISSNRSSLTIRDGIAGGLELKFFNDIYVNAPIKESFSFLSPFELIWSEDHGFYVLYKNNYVCDCEVLPLPSFAGEVLSSGTKFEDIGQIFTDRLGLYPFRSCRYNSRNGKSCKFCEIGYQTPMAPVPLEDLSELLDYCLQNKKEGMRHILVSGGVPSKNRWQYLVDTIRAIRQQTDLSIYHMLEPPAEIDLIKDLYEAGVDEIGFNLEIYNRDIAKEIMPGKGIIPYEKYKEAMLYAKKLWPEPGAVRSLLIVGLESIDETLKGVEAISSMGIMPILSPFRPVPGTELEHFPPPTGELMYKVWSSAQSICEKNNLTLGPTCVACQNNTITIPISEEYKHY